MQGDWEQTPLAEVRIEVAASGTVFTAATTDWAHGLRGGDKAVERITRNVLDRLSR